MIRLRRHIAIPLLYVLLISTLVIPFLHDLGHYLEGEHHEHGHHVHPDTTSALDNSQHLLSTDLSCVLCNGSTAELYSLVVVESERPVRSGSFHSFLGLSTLTIKYSYPFQRGPPSLPYNHT